MPQQPYLAVQFNTATQLMDTTLAFAPSLIYPSTPPPGQTILASGTLVVGNLVSLINSGGSLKAALAYAGASCSQAVLPAQGFVLNNYSNGQQVQVFLAGLFTASVPGASVSSVGSLVYLSDGTQGGASLTPPLPGNNWTPNTVYNLGSTIVDSNGNWETVTTAGTSGATEPPATPPGGGGAWSVVCNGTTTDGSVIWTMSPAHLLQVVGTIVYYNPVTTQCTIDFQPLLNIGDVSSVGLSMPSDFSVGNSPIITAGTLTVAWLPQNANLVHAGPVSGIAAVPTWRNSVPADFGTAILAHTFLAGSTSGTGAASFRLITISDLPFTGTPSASTYARGDGVWAALPSTLSFADLTTGVNTTATMMVGPGAILTFSSAGSPPVTGVINANALYGVAISSVPPTEGQSLVATSSSTAEWQTTPLAGVVSLVGPASSQAVTYSTPYTTTNAPIVVVTALNSDPSALGGVWVTNQGSAGNWTGFTINVTTGPAVSPPTTVEFNYAIMSAQS